MEKELLVLLAIGMIILLVSLIMLLLRIKKKSKIPLGAISLMLIIGTGSIAGSIILPNLKEKVTNATSEKGAEVAAEGKNSEKGQDDSIKTITEFNPTELKYPIITYQDKYSEYKEFKDADGTEYKNLTMINPNGVMMGFRSIDEAIVATPADNPSNDGFSYYQGYHYYKGSFTFNVSEGMYKYESKEAPAYKYVDFTSQKTESYNDLDMELYDFVYKFMPIQTPNHMVKVPLLEGEWGAYEDTIMNGQQVLAKMNFFKDGFLLIENNIVNTNEIPSNIQYKLEYLDENAYKLYLYPVTGTGSDGEYTISEEPAKRNFIIYVTSKDTFELVYYDINLKRKSITMKRE